MLKLENGNISQSKMLKLENGNISQSKMLVELEIVGRRNNE